MTRVPQVYYAAINDWNSNQYLPLEALVSYLVCSETGSFQNHVLGPLILVLGMKRASLDCSLVELCIFCFCFYCGRESFVLLL